MQLGKLLALAPFLSLASAGVFVQGFNDPGTCNQGVGGTFLGTNGECVEFNVAYNAVQVAGGGSESCFLEVFFGPGCTDQVPTNLGPIDQPNLGSCVGGFPPTFNTPIVSGRLLNCPQ